MYSLLYHYGGGGMISLKKASCLFVAFALLFVCLSACRQDDVDDNMLITNKQTYLAGEDIFVTAQGGGDSWVGMYYVSANVNADNLIMWYSVCKNGYVSGQTVRLQKCATVTESRFASLPGGLTYKLILFADSGYQNILVQKEITISKEELTLPEAPVSATYSLDNISDGLANGTLEVKFAEEDFTATELVMYWANADGILQEYTALAMQKVYYADAEYSMRSNTIIPPDATSLRIYAKNKLGVSEQYYEVDLLDGCQFDLSNDVLYEFQVVSDIHISTVNYEQGSGDNTAALHDEHFENMCADIAQNSPNSQGVFVNGDIANFGQESEYLHMLEIKDKYTTLPVFYYAIGNHDLYPYKNSYATQAELFRKYANISEYSNSDTVYYCVNVNGVYHIVLGSENKNSGVDAYLSDEQLSWFEKQLATIVATDADAKIFVYLHQSLYNTVAGSFEGQGWNGVTQDAELRAILKKYPQVYFFNGHSHWDMNSDGNMYARDDELPNIFNCGAVAYLWSSYDIPTGEYLQGSQGYYVRIYADKVLVLGRDFESGQWIPSACYLAK